MLLVTEAPHALEGSLRGHEAALREIAESAGAKLRLAVRLDDDPLAAEAGGETRAIRPLHGLVELTVDGDDAAPLLDVVAALTAELGDAADWSASAVSIGAVHQVVPPGDDTLLLTLAATRLPTLDRKGFHDYWLEQHAALAMSLLDDEQQKAKMGYEQVHADEEATAAATALAGTAARTVRRDLGVLARGDHRPSPPHGAGLRRRDRERRGELRRPHRRDVRLVPAHTPARGASS